MYLVCDTFKYLNIKQASEVMFKFQVATLYCLTIFNKISSMVATIIWLSCYTLLVICWLKVKLLSLPNKPDKQHASLVEV